MLFHVGTLHSCTMSRHRQHVMLLVCWGSWAGRELVLPFRAQLRRPKRRRDALGIMDSLEGPPVNQTMHQTAPHAYEDRHAVQGGGSGAWARAAASRAGRAAPCRRGLQGAAPAAAPAAPAARRRRRCVPSPAARVGWGGGGGGGGSSSLVNRSMFRGQGTCRAAGRAGSRRGLRDSSERWQQRPVPERRANTQSRAPDPTPAVPCRPLSLAAARAELSRRSIKQQEKKGGQQARHLPPAPRG
jgi:hypothetical protein